MVGEFERGKQICGETNPRHGDTLALAKLTEALNFFGPNSYGNYLQVCLAVFTLAPLKFGKL